MDEHVKLVPVNVCSGGAVVVVVEDVVLDVVVELVVVVVVVGVVSYHWHPC